MYPMAIPVPFPSTDLDELSHTKRPRPEDDDGDRERNRNRRRLSLPSVPNLSSNPDSNAVYLQPSVFKPSSLPHTSTLGQHLRSHDHSRPRHHTPSRSFRRPTQKMDVEPAEIAEPLQAVQGDELASPLLDTGLFWYQDPLPAITHIPTENADVALANVQSIANLDLATVNQIPQETLAKALHDLLCIMPPGDQRAVSLFMLKRRPVEDLTPAEIHDVAVQICTLGVVNGRFVDPFAASS